MAKDKLLRWVRLYLDGYDLSGDSRTFAALDNAVGAADMTVWNDAMHKFLADQEYAVGLRGYQALMDDASAGAFTQLKDAAAATARQLSVLFGSLAEPAVGDPAYLLPGVQLSAPIGRDGAAFVIQADFVPIAGAYSIGTPWGKVLFAKTSLAATTNGATLDNGAATSDGWHANLHVLAASSGAWSFKIEHSPNGTSWAILHTFTADGQTLLGEYASGTGTVDRYTRFVATRTAGTVTVACTFARK